MSVLYFSYFGAFWFNITFTFTLQLSGVRRRDKGQIIKMVIIMITITETESHQK